ncbi:peptidoglycan bridge formation glycyltransferase FemA/FemB family protein [bacterium]|nr:peptidoglycan bridge formation glycyltransferase FemA/FemB family protein [bacterium]NCQ55008.1 peptidoglycan bridge formation glycyltransferase FemA/FemB family protein [Candidatus Parcubacteria bacterium]NCS67052.1 peptidoglycan bridge formation glycyltransferase FemA/FemB family protein [Candidatus Peregrinibacteria bacterium]NCS95998.1 peptidoglycan bridge formation glycyltransferase FemA/FemB family protein [bacterium]
MNWELKTFNTDDAVAWDAFIKEASDGSIHQCTAWREFQKTIPGREQVLGFYAVDKSGKWLAATWCVKMSTGFLSTHWYYSARGPVIKTEAKTIRADFLKQISEHLKKEKGLFWRLDPYWQNSDWVAIKSEAQTLQIENATKNFQPTDSLLLDLRPEADVISAQMHRQGRKALRLADNAGVQVEILSASEVTPEHFNDWQTLNKDTTKRDGFFGHDKTYYENFIKTLSPATYLCLAQHEGKTVAAAILTVHHEKAIYYFGASSSDPDSRDLRAPYALQWAMILKAKSLGAKTYDFTGITPEDQPDHPYKGITQFKTRFGGYRSTYANGREVVLNPTWYKLYRLIKKIKS